jgi:hypothetical protein
MTFESKVMAVVADTVGTNDTNGFFNGTLFVVCDSGEAVELAYALTGHFGPVEVTPQAGHMEYAFDFIA